MKKFLALLLCLSMLLTLMPAVFATETTPTEDVTTQAETTAETTAATESATEPATEPATTAATEETTVETTAETTEATTEATEETTEETTEATEETTEPTEGESFTTFTTLDGSKVKVEDIVYIKPGQKIYKEASEDAKSYTLSMATFRIQITEMIPDATGTVTWYKFEYKPEDLGDLILNWFLSDYQYVKVSSTSVTDPDKEDEPAKEWTVEDKSYTASNDVVIQKTEETKEADVISHLDLEDNRNAYAIDIHGEDGVDTTISVSGILNTNAHKNVLVLHLLDSADAITKAINAGGVAWSYFTVSDASLYEKEVAAAKEATGADNRVYYVTLTADIAADGTISFQTDSFSTFLYIVTFEYEGYTYELSGGGTMYLSDLMKGLNLSQSVSDVTAVSFSDATLVTAEKSQGDWILRSENSFHTEEYMTLTFADGTSLKVKLTDPTVMYCVSHTDRLNTNGTTTHTINRSEASDNPYKSNAVVNATTITTSDVSGASDGKDDTKDLVIYAAPGMAIQFTSGIGFPDVTWEIAKSNSDDYKHDNWEWVWSGNTNYILLNESITESTYVDFNVTANSKTCNVRIWIIPNPSNNKVTKVRDTVKDSEEYEVRTIPVTLYDYDGYKWNQYWSSVSDYWFAFSGRVKGTYTQNGATKTIPWGGNHLPNSGDLSQGIFTDKLDDNNLPVFASTAQTDVFGKTTNEAMGKTVYNDVGFEFIYEKNNGFYTYSSNLNHAQYNQSTNTIELYDQTLSSQMGAEIANQANTVAGFYPFQDIEKAIHNWGYNGSGWQGHLSDGYDTRSYGQYAWDLVHSTDSTATINLHFAIQIEADFYMPVDRKSQVDNSNLVYEFTGDDDLWVFVDDQLVLDLGGAHSPISGKVDFTSETVTVQYYYPVKADGNTYTLQNVNNSEKIFTFQELGINVEADQMHTLRVFYMERWSGESNCRMRFNLPLAPENSVLVSKELTNQDGEDFSVTPDVDYTFQVFTALSDSKKDDILNEEASAFKPLADTEYYILGNESTKLKTDDEGKFKLKPGQTAVFTGIPRFTEVYAVELKPDDGYVYTASLVSVNGATAGEYEYGEKTSTEIVKRTSNITFKFTNRMQTQPLTFTKEVVNGTDGLIDKSQKFTFDLNFTKAILETGENAIKANDGKTLTNGMTFQLSHGESITIPRVPVNMTFDFGEQNPDTAKNSFDKPKYELTKVTCTGTPNDFTKYSWTVANGGENKIKVINQQRFDLTIEKNGILSVDHDEGTNPEEQQSTMYTVVGKAGNETLYEGTVAICGNSSVTIKDLPVGNYTVTELTDWAWRYEPDGGAEKTPDILAETKVTYDNKRTEKYWLSGDNYVRNFWGKTSTN